MTLQEQAAEVAEAGKNEEDDYVKGEEAEETKGMKEATEDDLNGDK